jgi:hypothetical protein
MFPIIFPLIFLDKYMLLIEKREELFSALERSCLNSEELHNLHYL